jgi:hypothetical protein
MRLCPRKAAAAARTGTGGRGHLEVGRGHPAGAAPGLRGSGTEADVRQAPAAPGRRALWRLGGAACATPQQALLYRALAARRAWPPPTAAGESGTL